MFQHLPFPFEGGRFPSSLGAVVQRTVLSGEQPAREVVEANAPLATTTGSATGHADQPLAAV